MAMYGQTFMFNGLGTLTVSAPVAGRYFVDGKISLPTISEGSSPSSVLVVVNQNGSPVYTGVAGNEGFYVEFIAAFNDTIAVVFSSAAAVDNQLNAVKSTIAIGTK